MTPLYFLFSDSNKNNIYIKRDDLIPISFGGNKARKAMNFFKEIDQGGFDCVVTYGSGSSNHCRIVSNMAASRKLPCYIVAPKESSLPTFNSKMMELFGSHFMITPVRIFLFSTIVHQFRANVNRMCMGSCTGRVYDWGCHAENFYDIMSR